MHTIEYMPPAALKPNPRNVRTHSKKQIRQIADSIKAFGFTTPALIDETGILLAGHGRVAAAKLLGLKAIPVIKVVGLTEAKKRALLLADNKIAENAGWDRKRLAVEIPELSQLLIDESLDISLTGFEAVEIDQLAVDFEEKSADPADTIQDEWLSAPVVSRQGDLWLLGEHRLLCGDARSTSDLDLLLEGEEAAMAFLDPPYNVKIAGVVGRGRIKHREFAMASGEMSPESFVQFLVETLGNAEAHSRAGAVHYVCMDWRHLGELLAAGEQIYNEMLNLVVWAKSNAGQGSFYRSAHELIGVFKVGDAPYLNNIELGRHGRYRSNVWTYAGVNSFKAGRLDELKLHPTVKPVALVADAMKDVTRRGDIVLDTFCGSGTTNLGAERVGRRARGLELDPRYVDVAVQRWQSFTRADALHAETGLTFDEVSRDRAAVRESDSAPSPSRRRPQ